MLKKIILSLLISISILGSVYAEIDIDDGTSLAEDRQFVIYMVMGPFFERFYKNPTSNMGVEIVYTPIVDANNKTVGVEPKKRDFKFSNELIDFFSNKKNLENLFIENGMEGVEEIFVTEQGNLLNTGFMICGRVGEDFYFIPIVGRGEYQLEEIQHETYGGFRHKKVHTHAEILELCAPRECKMFIDGEEIKCEPAITMLNGSLRVPLRSIIETLGGQVDWDNDLNKVTFTNPLNGAVYSSILNNETGSFLSIYEGEKLISTGSMFLKDDRIIMRHETFSFIAREYNLKNVGYDMNNFVVAYEQVT